MNFLWIVLMLFSFNLLAQDSGDPSILTDEQLRSLEQTEDDSYGDQIFVGQDLETGIKQLINTSNDSTRWAFTYHWKADFLDAQEVSEIEAVWSRRLNHRLWWELYAAAISAEYGAITTHNASVGAATGTSDDEDDNITVIGAGLSYRSFYIQDFIGWDRIYEIFGASAGYYYLRENAFSATYKGPGLKADWVMNYRWPSGWHWGVKWSYHLALVKREERFVNESNSSRSLTLSWLSMGFDFGYNY